MEKYLTWGEALKRFMPLLFVIVLGGFFIYMGAYEWSRPSYSLTSWLWGFANIVLGISLFALVLFALLRLKSTPIIICPKCRRELSLAEVEYGHTLCCREELKENETQ